MKKLPESGRGVKPGAANEHYRSYVEYGIMLSGFRKSLRMRKSGEELLNITAEALATLR
jgi:hypothetical protein